MNYSQLLKEIKFIEVGQSKISTNSISCQYNYDRFHLYKKYCLDQSSPLNIKNAPHLDLLKKYDRNKIIKNSLYHQMHYAYGKPKLWVKEKVKKFIELYKDINENGLKNPIQVLKNPIIKNEYNNNWEVYEGHHRLAIYYHLGIKEIPCIIIDFKKGDNYKKKK